MSVNNRSTCPEIRIRRIDVKCDPNLLNEDGSASTGPEPTLVPNEFGSSTWVKPDFSIYDTTGKPYKVTLYLEVSSGSWEKESMLLSFLRVQVVQCYNSDVSADIESGKLSLQEDLYRDLDSDYRIESFSVGQDENGNDFVNRKFKVEFILNQKPGHLTYFASCFVDYLSMSASFNLSLPDSRKSLMYGPVQGKKIFHEGTFQKEVEGLFLSNGKIYSDQTHIGLPGDIRTGRKINDELMGSDLFSVLETWLERDATTTAGIYYAELLAVATIRSDLLREMKRLLDTWTVRDATLTAGTYYLDLQKVYNYYAAVSGEEDILTKKQIPNAGVVLDESLCRRFTPLCETSKGKDLPAKYASIKDYIANKESFSGTYYTNLLWTLGPLLPNRSNGAGKLFFSLDFIGILKNRIKNSCLLTNTNREILEEFVNHIHVRSVTIERKRLDAQISTSGQPEGASHVVTGFRNDQGLIMGQQFKNRRVKKTIEAVIRELKNINLSNLNSSTASSYTNSHFKHFTVKDNYIADQKTGEYEYSVSIIIEDKSDNFIIKRLNALSQARRILQNYYNTSTLACSYDSQTGFFTEEFIKHQYRNYTGKDAPWLIAPITFADMLRCFYDISDSDGYDVASEMFLKLDPQHSSPESISSVLQELQILENEISRNFGIKIGLGNDKKGSSKGKSNANTFQTSHRFNDALEILDLNIAPSPDLGGAGTTAEGSEGIDVGRSDLPLTETEYGTIAPLAQTAPGVDTGGI